MERLITGAFADILKAEREHLNAHFAEAKRTHPNIDPDAFKALLIETVAPIVSAVEACMPTATRETALTLYDLALDLLAQDLLGPNSRYPFIAQGWQDLLPKLAPKIALSPRAVIGSLTNALYNLSQVPNARPQEWVASMLALAHLTSDTAAFLQAGQIAAWRAGLADYRTGALALCSKIPPALARAALGLDASRESPPMETIVQRLSADPWLLPASIENPPHAERRLKIVTRVGAFRGLGGLFRTPPTVATMGDYFVVKDDSTSWLLVADRFGATFHRADGAQPAQVPSPFKLGKNGAVSCDRYAETFPELADYTSVAANATTLAVTSSLSFAVTLVALADP